MRLESLFRDLSAPIHGDPQIEVTDIAYDSRQVQPRSLFVALTGASSNGHEFIPDAIRAGAAALLVEDPPQDASIPYAVVSNTRLALADVATTFYERPGDRLQLVGVTGTNGKTSTVRMIESILNHADRSAGIIGTISIRYPGFEAPSSLTTPESLDLQRTLAAMCNAAVDTAVLEVSSHSLSQGRVRNLRFTVAVFTQLSQDHLDYHGTMDEYAAAKALLFGPEYLSGTAVINAMDPRGIALTELAQSHAKSVIRFGRGREVDAEIKSIEESVELDGSRLVVEENGKAHALHLPLPGDFQLENALAAIGAARALNLDWTDIISGLEHCPPVPGRLERVSSARPVVLVDYAHTPGALESILARVRPLVSGRLITVFGCGGDRDRSKRVPMAAAASRYSDYTVATSDNPRMEDPDAILGEVAKGLVGSHRIIVDRREAIEHAIKTANLDDVVIIAGKGHEDYQILGRERIRFDDREVARDALTRRGAES